MSYVKKNVGRMSFATCISLFYDIIKKMFALVFMLLIDVD